MEELKTCPNCGFTALITQWQKTLLVCPRCHPEEGQAYLDRKAGLRPHV